MREFNEPPNPLIPFLAREMGLFSPFRLPWVGRKMWENRGDGGSLAWGGGLGEPAKPQGGGGQQLLVTARCGSQDGERCPVCPAQGGEGHGQVPLPRQVQTP